VCLIAHICLGPSSTEGLETFGAQPKYLYGTSIQATNKNGALIVHFQCPFEACKVLACSRGSSNANYFTTKWLRQWHRQLEVAGSTSETHWKLQQNSDVQPVTLPNRPQVIYTGTGLLQEARRPHLARLRQQLMLIENFRDVLGGHQVFIRCA
jgi:hypothetical protein